MTKAEIKELMEWHQSRLLELNYPTEIYWEFVTVRNEWISRVTITKNTVDV
jgi:hypothetical protein